MNIKNKKGLINPLILILFFIIIISIYTYYILIKTPETHYIVKKLPDTTLIFGKAAMNGDVIKVNRPVIYYNNIEHCEDLTKYEALNTLCLFNKKTNKVLDLSIDGNTFASSLKTKNNKPLDIEIKKDRVFKIIEKFQVKNSDYLYRLFNSPIDYVLLEDQDGNKIELSYLDDLKNQNKLSKEEKEIFNLSNFKEGKKIIKKLCYLEEQDNKKIKNLIKDLNIENKIILENDYCYYPKKRKGVKITTKDPIAYLKIKKNILKYNISGYWK